MEMPPCAGGWRDNLAIEHGWWVRLWIDDPAPLAADWCRTFATGPVAVRFMAAIRGRRLGRRTMSPTSSSKPSPANFRPAYVEAMAATIAAAGLAEPRIPLCGNLGGRLPRLAFTASAPAAASRISTFPALMPGTGGLLRERMTTKPGVRRFDEAAFRAEFGLPPKDTRRNHDLPVQLCRHHRMAPTAGIEGMDRSRHARSGFCDPAVRRSFAHRPET
jgi:hypothetical protein